MHKMLIALALAAILLADPALAQFTPSPDSKVDLAPIINPLMQLFGTIIMFLGIPLAYGWMRKTLKSWGIEATNELNATQAVVDSIAQKAIGGAITKYAVKPGQVTVDVKSEIIAEAAKTLVANASDSLTKLSVPDNEKLHKAREIISSRLGLMDAAAAGAPVPNPSQPAVVAVASAAPDPAPAAKR